MVVDDVREISDPAALSELESLVRHGMGRLHLVLSCRRDPALPLYRWRVNGSLTEMRTTDLSLTITETAQLLAAHDVVLPGSTLYALHSMTEGWPAGVRLAAMAMRGHPEPERVLDDGGPYSTAVGDFLTGEVIETLPADTRRLLFDTAVATRLNAGLVEAITGRDDGARVLAELKGSNAFLTRNAGPGGWYRFHPLFARTLHSELLRRNPERVAELHRRAAAWHSTTASRRRRCATRCSPRTGRARSRPSTGTGRTSSAGSATTARTRPRRTRRPSTSTPTRGWPWRSRRSACASATWKAPATSCAAATARPTPRARPPPR